MADWELYPLSGELILTDHKLLFPKMPAPAAGIFDSPVACVRINAEWLSFVIGRLDVLTEPLAWLGNDTEQHRASQQIAELLNAMAATDATLCADCPEPPVCPEVDPPSLRQNGNCIEWLNPATSAWECQLILELPTVASSISCDDCCEECGDCEECDDCEGW